jgi:SPP1 gp7 family putative phage head morphogenesis protein
MASNLKLPNRKLTDATHTSILRKTYWDKLVALFKRFNKELQPGFERMMNRNTTIKEFSDKLNTTSDITIYAGAPKIIDENIKLSYNAGKQRAISNPRIQGSIRIDPRLSFYDMRTIEDLKARNMSLVTKLTEDIKSELIRIITNDIREARTIKDMVKDITTNIEDISKARAKMIARTEIAYSYNTAISETYKKAGIEQWQWLATLGYNCCEECIANHGQIFEWDDVQPPLHPNCFCTILPVIEKY